MKLKIGDWIKLTNPDSDLKNLKGGKGRIKRIHSESDEVDVKFINSTIPEDQIDPDENNETGIDGIRIHEITPLNRKAMVYKRTG